jgi:hypothetical protein
MMPEFVKTGEGRGSTLRRCMCSKRSRTAKEPLQLKIQLTPSGSDLTVLLSDIWNAALSGTKREADIAFDARPDANTIHARTSTNRQRARRPLSHLEVHLPRKGAAIRQR